MRYLLAAEADKIQEFIFRSSRLREVVGASQLLSRFCREGAPPLLQEHGGDPGRDILVNDGGSFRVVFEDPNPDLARRRAVEFGADLAELYRLSLGGSLSVAEPVEMDEGFPTANEQASKALRRAKEHRRGAIAEPHMPYVAFCASCGVGLAEQHTRLSGEPSGAKSRYLCRDCRNKAFERDRKPRAILDDFYRAYCLAAEMDPDTAPGADWPEDADDVAGFDLGGRSYVAYLVADGNNMGKIFGACDEKQIRQFSEGLSGELAASLAESAVAFRTAMSTKGAMVPVLPLILGGDDLFALIPAAYALDFARRFCLAYEKRIKGLVDKLNIEAPKPTVAAAVVICKSKYPYALAHHRAEQLLKEAKRQCKLLVRHSGERCSAVHFEVILGNRLAGQETEAEERREFIRTTLRPYWAVGADGALSDTASQYGIGLHQLLAQRLALKDVPNKRLIEVRRRFADLPQKITSSNRVAQLEQWTAGLQTPFSRSGKVLEPKLHGAMASLGQPPQAGSHKHHWRELYRDGQIVLAHGMLDLLEAWDFCQDLNCRPDAYEVEKGES